MKRVLQPLPSLGSNNSLLQLTYPSAVERRPYLGKGKGKARYVHTKYTQQKKKPRFHKKIVVIRYMGPKAPSTFTIKERFVFLQGMLPEIGYEYSEKQIRKSISDTINASELVLVAVEPNDFEFLEAFGKQLCVPAQAPELEWTGRALKQLAGSGCVYVRLIYEISVAESENSDSIDSAIACSSPELKIVKVETPGNEAINMHCYCIHYYCCVFHRHKK